MRVFANFDYRISHKAPGREGKNTLDDPSDIFPDDIYSNMGWRYYGFGADYTSLDKKCHKKFIEYRGKPDKKVWIYRAAPKKADKINPGDWVTICEEYAKRHGDLWLDDYHILKKLVPAKHVCTEGGGLEEFGYCPN